MTPSNPNQPEFRRFTMHPNLLWEVISRQAGTPEKAIAELVSNCHDADAQRIDVTVSSTGFRVADDGTGFSDRDNILAVFEQFGLPQENAHSAGGRERYGAFRMGRGQVMALASCSWRTGQYQMNVDLRPDPTNDRPTSDLGYHLTEDLPDQPGCIVEGTWYNPLNIHTVENLKRVLRESLAWLSVPLFVNRQQVNKLPQNHTWARETDDAWIDARSTQTLSVYNRGVFVISYPASRYGFGGVIVSKSNLKVNFARSELSSGCPVWARITESVKDLRRAEQRARPELTDAEAQRVLEDILDGAQLPDIPTLEKLRLFTDLANRNYTITKLAQLPHLVVNNHARPRNDSPDDGDRKEHALREQRLRRLTKAKSAIALSPTSFNLLRGEGATPAAQLTAGLATLADAILKHGQDVRNYHIMGIAQNLRAIEVLDLDVFTLANIEPLAAHQLGKQESAMLAAARRAGRAVAKHLNKSERSIEATATGDLDWATDGVGMILIEKDLLGALGSTTSRSFFQLAYMLVAAYVAGDSKNSTDRDPAFLEAVHETVSTTKAQEFALEKLHQGYIRACHERGISPSVEALRSINRSATQTDDDDDNTPPASGGTMH